MHANIFYLYTKLLMYRKSTLTIISIKLYVIVSFLALHNWFEVIDGLLNIFSLYRSICVTLINGFSIGDTIDSNVGY